MNAETVKPGMAGVYDLYVIDRGFYQVQKEAQSNRRGLWADPALVPLGRWRSGERVTPDVERPLRRRSTGRFGSGAVSHGFWKRTLKPAAVITH